jgi:hypothetical protein
MSIKTLFEKQKQASNPFKKLESKSAQEFATEVESSEYITQYQNSIDLYLQDVNFATASNFARFGSARKYYENIIDRVTNYFPYDGSKASQLEFQNNLNPFEKYIYLYEYPKTTGYINFASNGWGTKAATYSTIGYPTNKEYISFYNQNNDNIYSPENGLRENTRFIFSSGSTIEFWMKKNMFVPVASSSYECIFYMASTGSNNKESSFSITLNTTLTSSVYIWYYTNQNNVSINQEIGFTYNTGLTTIADSNWHHYAFTFYSGSTGYTSDFYLDGVYKNTQTNTNTIVNFTGSAFCTLGAFGGQFVNYDTPIGSGKLSGSIDEFRFWNVKRNAKEIGLNYFTNVGGGNNVANTTNLGVYFKFNEGITGVSATDSVVLDYAGRNCNGSFTGYSTLSRNTGSAITSTQERPESGVPILYYNHPSVQSYLQDRLYYADEYDYQNNFMLKNSMPSWILDDDANNGDILVNFLQTLSSYLDTLYLQISTYKSLKNKDYLNYEGKAPPFSDLLLTSNGFDLPALFLNTDIVQSLFDQDTKRTYDEKINDLKNIIYKNIYNNLNIIYKSKGTENSIKQLIKTFGVGDNVFSLNIYGNNTQYVLEDTYSNKSLKKDYIDFTPFSSSTNANAVIYQAQTDTGTSAFITGSSNGRLSFTAECNVIVPEFPKTYDYLAYQTLTWNTSSVFGIRTADNNASSTDVPTNDPAGLKVRFIYRDDKGYFQLSYPSASIALTSSIFSDITTNQHWNLSVRLSPVSTGSSYNLEFSGYSNYVSEDFRSFSVSSSISSASGSLLLSNNKRLYLGAERTNITGTLAYGSLFKGLSARYWADYLTGQELIDHAKNPFSYGRLNPSEPYSLATSSYIPKSETLLLHWDFTNVTSSDSNGLINLVYDLTSGSSGGNRYSNTPLQDFVGKRYDGKGYGFKPSSTIKNYELVFSSEQQLPENIYSSQLINILTTDDDYYTTTIRPQGYFFAVENSMYGVISKNILNMFATIVEFNNLIGTPINTYKSGYSRLKYFRKLFFDKVQNIPDLDKYIGIYKWIDDALDSVLFNLLPASANASEKVRTIIENHILERSKVSYPLAPDQGVIVTGGEKMLKVNNMANSQDLSKPLRAKEAVQEHIGKYDSTVPGYSSPEGGYSTKFEKSLSPISSNSSGRRTITIAGTAAARAGRK